MSTRDAEYVAENQWYEDHAGPDHDWRAVGAFLYCRSHTPWSRRPAHIDGADDAS